MKTRLAVGLPVAGLGALLAFVPGHIFPVCAVAHGAAPMRCHWTGAALSGFGAAFFLLGVMLFFCGDAGARRGISLAVVVMAVLAGLMPAHLIGMCGSPAMPCRVGTYPAAMILLSMIALSGLANALVLKRVGAKETQAHEAAHDIPYSLEQS